MAKENEGSIVYTNINNLDVDDYYKKTFMEIEESGSKIKWNWYAFLFTIFWYFYKRMGVKGLIMLAIPAATMGFTYPLIWLYSGLMGNYDYYQLKVKKSQLWK